MPYTLRRASGTQVPPCDDAMRRLSKISALEIIPEDKSARDKSAP